MYNFYEDMKQADKVGWLPDATYETPSHDDLSFFYSYRTKKAEELVKAYLSESSDRYNHTMAVGNTMVELLKGYHESVINYGYCLGILHDIGYGQVLTRLHAADGAYILENQPEECLKVFAEEVRHHSTALWEGQVSQLRVPMAPEGLDMLGSFWHSYLWVADFIASPKGGNIHMYERLEGIHTRYDEDSPVITALTRSIPHLAHACNLVSSTSLGNLNSLIADPNRLVNMYK